MTDLISLAERVEKATADEQREMLIEAWNAVHPGNHVAWDGTAIAPYRVGFLRFIEAEAWLDAAMMLVPEGCAFELATAPDSATVRVFTWNRFRQLSGVNTATPALALTAACLRAHAAGERS